MHQAHDIDAMQKAVKHDDDRDLALSALIEGEATLTMFGAQMEDWDGSQISGVPAENLGRAYDADGPDGIRGRRISDHARTLAFTIHENIKPSNEMQGYVVRRLLRRAVLDAYQMGRREPFLAQIIPTVAEVMARPYPELLESVPRIQTVVREEEEQFLRNLENGLKLLNEGLEAYRKAGPEARLALEGILLLILMAALAFCVCVLSNAHADLARHFYVFHALVDLTLVADVVWGVAALAAGVRSPWRI